MPGRCPDAAGPTDLDLVTAPLRALHHAATGQPLDPERARRFGTALLAELVGQAERSRTPQCPVAVVRAPDPDAPDLDALYLIAGDTTGPDNVHTGVTHLIATLILREPAAPALGLRAEWRAAVQDPDAGAGRLTRRPWASELHLQAQLLCLALASQRRGLSHADALQRAARLLTLATHKTIDVGGHRHGPPQETHARTLH